MAGDVLSQSEIDELLSALSTGVVSAEEMKVEQTQRKIKVYDFKRPDKFSKDQIRTLYMLHENIHTTFPEIITALLHGNAIQWVKQIVASDCDEAKDYLGSYYGTNEKNVSGCYNTACVAVRSLNAGALNILLDSSNYSLSPQDLEDGYDIYIEIPQDKIKQYSKMLMKMF